MPYYQELILSLMFLAMGILSFVGAFYFIRKVSLGGMDVEEMKYAMFGAWFFSLCFIFMVVILYLVW
jgi:hypothetical protein